MAEQHVHETHPAIVKRLKRADGHLRGIIEMIEAGRSCLDIAQQLHAVEKAIGQAKKTLIQDHLDQAFKTSWARWRVTNVARSMSSRKSPSICEVRISIIPSFFSLLITT